MTMKFRRKYLINEVSRVIIELKSKYANCVLRAMCTQTGIREYQLLDILFIRRFAKLSDPQPAHVCPFWSSLYSQLSNNRSYFFNNPDFTLGSIIVDNMPWLHTIRHHVIHLHCKQIIAWHLLNPVTRTTVLFYFFCKISTLSSKA